MNIVDVFRYSARSIKVQKGRAALTILGVVIGITAIVALNGLTGGFSNLISGQLGSGTGAETLSVSPGGGLIAGFTGRSSGPSANLYVNNITGLQAIPNVKYVLGELDAKVSFYSDINGSNVSAYTASVTAVDFATYADVFPTTFSTAGTGGLGTIPTDNNSIVIGYDLYHPYTQNNSVLVPFGQNLTMYYETVNSSQVIKHPISLNVTAVLGQIGGFSLSGGPSDNGIYMPLSLAQQYFNTVLLSTIIVQVDSPNQAIITNVTNAIKAYFAPAGAVSVLSATSLIGTISTILGTVSDLLTAIAAISLIVAGVGIMNIMTVSIIERTREIGILKAIGATDRSVLGIFLVEALMIGLIGSLIGLGLGYLGAFGLGALLFRFASSGATTGVFGGGGSTFIPVISPELIALAILFGVLVAVVFALYPALKASRKPPVEALRFE
jgi:putative ABC transport system permease protein